MVLISILGVMSTPFMVFIDAGQTHFKHPELSFTLGDIYDVSLLYSMLLTNMMIYVAITAYLFSREYTENTLKTILPIPISRMAFMLGKFCILFLWIIVLTVVIWGSILILFALYHVVFGMQEFSFVVAGEWLLKLLLGSVFMFLTISPFAFIAEKTKGFVAPVDCFRSHCHGECLPFQSRIRCVISVDNCFLFDKRKNRKYRVSNLVGNRYYRFGIRHRFLCDI